MRSPSVAAGCFAYVAISLLALATAWAVWAVVATGSVGFAVLATLLAVVWFLSGIAVAAIVGDL